MTTGVSGRGASGRSGTLTAGVFLVIVAALCGLTTLVLTLTGGKEMLRGVLEDVLKTRFGVSTQAGGVGSGLIDSALVDAYATLTTRAYFFTFIAVVFLLLAVFMWSRRNWARIAFVVFALAGLGMWLLDLSDDGPTSLHIVDGVAIGATLVALVMIWLGPSNRAIKAAKAERAGRL
jgi:hypothetical protein